jgi:L-threonylcarbamoyladenylate synthase
VSPFGLRLAARTLRDGGVVAYPTEAVYGLGCDPLNRAAVERVLAIKRRPLAKGLILIASRLEQLAPLVLPMDEALEARVLPTWPGPATWLLPARAATPVWLRGAHDTLAVRVTAHPVAAALCDAFGGAIVSTSANAAGSAPARSALQARLRCPGIDRAVPGATGGLSRPTPIRDARSGALVRPG